MARFFEFHDLDGDKTSVAANAVIGIEQGTYDVEWEETEVVENAPLVFRLLGLLLSVVEGNPRMQQAVSHVTETKKGTRPCTVIRMRLGNRTRKIKVTESYEQVVAALGGDRPAH